MKAFEVKIAIIGGSKDQSRTVFVEAESKKQIKSTKNILKIWDSDDMKPVECPMEILDGIISEK